MAEYLMDFKQTDTYNSIQKLILSNKFSNANIVYCDDKFSGGIVSRLIAMTLLCRQSRACGECEGCIRVKNNAHPDLYFFPKDKNFLVSDAAKIVEKAFAKPTLSDYNVFVIDNFDNANIAAQNKMLKALEETTNSYFIINAENPSRLLPTIKSRLNVFSLMPFSKSRLESILKNNYKAFNPALIDFSDGYLGNALYLIENGEESYNFVIKMLENMKASNEVINYSKDFAQKDSFILKLALLERIFRNMLVYKSDKTHLLSQYELSNLQKICEGYSVPAILQIIKRITKSKTYYEANVNLNIICDNLLLGILEDKYLWK